ncbi:Homoaconitase mitochondrial [Bienertia sinuspersici]
MEISLATKRKLGFVNNAIKRDERDNIKKSILHFNTAREIWLHLETCYNVTNGARKYKLNKEVYDTHQNGISINEYYTTMKSLWDEQDSLNILPANTQLNPKIDAFIGAMKKQREEERLFQFLLGVMKTTMLRGVSCLCKPHYQQLRQPVPNCNKKKLKGMC